MNLFYSPDLEDQGEYQLNAEESHHSIRVLRLGHDSEIILVNGRGGWFTGKIISPDPRGCRVDIISIIRDHGKPGWDLHLGIAPTKQADRFEWFLEKATEIGVSRITPVYCDHSERKEIKPDRLQKIVVAAMKQSLHAFHPVISPGISFREFIRVDQSETKAIAHCQGGKKLWLDTIYKKGRPVSILIGPEGDFSPGEIASALALGYSPVTLGDSRLRTETAGVVAVQTISWLSR
jgi:16S rRNA (uracil1498-N3)-methyltransferase